MKWIHRSLIYSLQTLFSTLPGTHRLLGVVDIHRRFIYLSTGTEASIPPFSALLSLRPKVLSPRHSQSYSHTPRTSGCHHLLSLFPLQHCSLCIMLAVTNLYNLCSLTSACLVLTAMVYFFPARWNSNSSFSKFP